MESIKPKYRHDCKECLFLGHWEGQDLYVCGAFFMYGRRVTLLARHSDEAGDYISGLPFVGIEPAITEACRRAIDKQLLSPEQLTGASDGKTLQQALNAATAAEGILQ